MVQFFDDPERCDLRAVEQGVCGVHAHDRAAHALYQMLQIVKAPLGQEGLQLLRQLSPVVQSFEPLIEAGVSGDVFGVERPAQGLPGFVLIVSVYEEVGIFALKAVVR